MTKNRIVYLDILRVLCCFLIVCMHSPMPSDNAISWFNGGLSFLTSPGLVLFFMISGALVMPVKTDTWTFLKKRLTKVAIPTLFFIVVHLIIKAIKEVETNWLQTIVAIPFAVSGHGVLWFCYTLVGLYLAAPIVSKWLQSVSPKELEFYLLIWVVTLCYPILKRFIGVNDGITGMLYYYMGYLGYFVLGYYLHHYPNRLSLWLLLFLSMIAVAAKFGVSYMGFHDDSTGIFYYLSLPVAIIATTMFVAAQKLIKTNENNARTIEKWGGVLTSNLSFGIFLVHIIIMLEVVKQMPFVIGIHNYIMQTVVIAFLTYLLSWLLAYLISWIPGSEYVIGFHQKKKNK